MSPCHARPVVLRAAERKKLKKCARGHKSPARDKLRAQIVWESAAGCRNAAIARRCQVSVDTVRKWRGRFAEQGLAGLADRQRSGRPARFTPTQQAEVKALACQLPAETDVPLSRWSNLELAREAVGRGICATVSPATIRRWLAGDAIKPWRFRSWIFVRDPDFAVKATVVLDLYRRRWDGKLLGDDEYVGPPSVVARIDAS
jgi:transposase